MQITRISHKLKRMPKVLYRFLAVSVSDHTGLRAVVTSFIRGRLFSILRSLDLVNGTLNDSNTKGNH